MKRLLRHRSAPKVLSWSKSYGLILILAVLGLAFLWQKFFQDFSAPRPTEGGIYTESVISRIYNLNPLTRTATNFDQDIHELIFEGLLDYNPASGQIEDALGQLRVSDDGKSYEITLKQSARFSDGHRVTIQDVLFTFEELIQNPHFGNEPLSKAFEYVTLDVLDDRTIKFTLPEQNVFFLSYLTTPILPLRYFKGALIEQVLDPNYNFNRNPVGAGPYKFKNLIPHRNGSYRVFLERNPHYHGQKPYIDQLVFYVYPDIEKLEAEQNESTMISGLPAAFEKVIQEQLVTEYQTQNYILPRYLGIFFNLDKRFPAEPSIRRALYLGLEKDRLLEKEKGWQRVESPFFFEGIETNFQVKDFITARETLRRANFPYNREQEIRTDGPNGGPLSLTMITSTAPASYSRMAQHIVRTWEQELDINIDLRVLEPQAFQEALRAREYDILFFGMDFSRNFDSLSPWHSSQSGKLNFSNLTRDDVDFLISEIRFTGAQSDFFVLSQKLDDLIPAIPVATPQYFTLVSQDLKGWDQAFARLRSYSDRFDTIDDWYFHEELAWDLGDRNKYWTFIKWLFGMAEKSEAEPEVQNEPVTQ